MSTADKNLSRYDKNSLPNANDFRFGIVVSEWNNDITEPMLQGAIDALIDNGCSPDNIISWYVPGSYELIYGSKKMQEQNVDAVIAIGSVIRGETAHFDYVCQAVSQGVKDLNIVNDIPVVFCVLTDDTHQQATDRSGGKHGNKGIEAAIAAIKMAQLRKEA